MTSVASLIAPLQSLSLGEYHLAYRRYSQEEGKGPTVVCIHGFMATQEVWDPLARLLAGSGSILTVITLDLLGFGASSQPPITYDIALEVQTLEHFCQSLGLEQVILIGHSFGGWVAAAHAIAHPERVQGLILLAPAGIRDDQFAGRYRWLMPLLWQSVWVDRALDWGSPLAAWLGQEQTWGELGWIRQQLQQQPVARQFLQARRRPEAATDTLEASLGQIQPPTLVIAAGQDDVIPLWHCQTYAAGIPKARLHILPQAGHRLPRYAQEIAPVVLEFLAGIGLRES